VPQAVQMKWGMGDLSLPDLIRQSILSESWMPGSSPA